MAYPDYPSKEIWEERLQWFESVEERTRGEAAYIVSEQACALTMDVQVAYCAGAWISVIILSMAVVDAALRETEIPGFRGNTQQLINTCAANPNLHRIRQRRNALVHIKPDNPAVTVDQQWSEQDKHESEAKEAIELMFEAFYIGPWV